MNAYELAKYLEDDFQIQEAVIDMLREQADRIAELEKDLHMIERHYDQLNTQTKPLSDEEISQVYKEISEPFGEKRLYEIHDFARAILKKASEK